MMGISFVEPIRDTVRKIVMLHLQSILTVSPNAYGVQLTNQKRLTLLERL